MFWIGMIVGIIAFIALATLFVFACFMVAGVNLEDFKGLVYLNNAIIYNRTCDVEVLCDDEPVYTDTFEEH